VNCWIGVDRTEGRRLVRVVGAFNHPQVPELLAACAPEEGPLELDLQDLVCADAAGIDTLRSLRAHGAILVRIPGYIGLKLNAGSDSPR
jgi:hypothetical protein